MKFKFPPSFLMICTFVITACSNPTESVDTDPFVIGTITEIEQHRIMVEENVSVNEPLEDGGIKIYFSVNDETKLFEQLSDGSLKKIAFTELKTGDKVKGWAAGAVADSYPQQGLAGQIILIE